MFGYHDNDRCGFDLWSPVDVKYNGSGDANRYNEYHDACHGGAFYDRDEIGNIIPHNATENRAFSPYAKHMQEVEDVIRMIIDNFDRGNMNMSFELDDDFSESDLNYIRQKVYQARGVYS